MSTDSIHSLKDVDFFSLSILSAPHNFLRRLRSEAPVFPAYQATHARVQYLVSTYELVQYVLHNAALFSSDYVHILSGGGAGDPEVDEIRRRGFQEVQSVLTSDDASHKRMRGLVGVAFTPIRIKAMSTILDGVIRTLIDRFARHGECDFSKEFASLLPTNALAHIMNFPPARHDDVTAWGAAIARRFGQMGTLSQRIADENTILAAKAYMVELIEERRRNPGTDLISDLVTAQIEGEAPLTELEILSTIMILLVGGTETTFATLNSAMAHLLQNPEMLDLLVSDESLVPLFIDEVLRFYPPVSAFWRIARSDLTLGGVKIPKGSVLMVRVDSANRDDAMFSQPDVFNIHRKNNARHLSFGGGLHACIGFRLARMELHQGLPALLKRLKKPRLDVAKSDLNMLPSTHARNLGCVYMHFQPEVVQ